LKTDLLPFVFVLLSISGLRGQGVVMYDQQSSDESIPGETWIAIQPYQPVGQSFTPSLSSVGFVRLQVYDGDVGNSRGATMYVNLRANSMSGTILSSTTPVSLPDGFFGGFQDFFFSTPVTVAPNSAYYFQPVIQSGDGFLLGQFIPTGDYLGGTEYRLGLPIPGVDLWFREGIVVPEPSSVVLAVLGGVTVWCFGRRNQRLSW
jgi:hypothetical protein